MAEDQPPAVVSSSAAPPIYASAMNEQQASQSSPATSDKTTIVSSPDHCASQKPKPPHTFTVSEYLGTSQKPPRSEPQPIRTSASPPLPPLIVRSNNTQGVVDHARRMLENSPARYLCFFPQCGYTIYDAWDSHDIRIDSAEFLTQVLTFITRDNVYRAQTYAHEWSQKNRHRLDFIAGEVPRMYNSSDPISIVDRIFINGETQSYPREFLWHVANIMRNGMVNAALKPQGTIAGDNIHNVEKANDDDRAGNDVLDTNAVMDAKPDMLTEEKEHRSEPDASNGTSKTYRKNFIHLGKRADRTIRHCASYLGSLDRVEFYNSYGSAVSGHTSNADTTFRAIATCSKGLSEPVSWVCHWSSAKHVISTHECVKYAVSQGRPKRATGLGLSFIQSAAFPSR